MRSRYKGSWLSSSSAPAGGGWTRCAVAASLCYRRPSAILRRAWWTESSNSHALSTPPSLAPTPHLLASPDEIAGNLPSRVFLNRFSHSRKQADAREAFDTPTRTLELCAPGDGAAGHRRAGAPPGCGAFFFRRLGTELVVVR